MSEATPQNNSTDNNQHSSEVTQASIGTRDERRMRPALLDPNQTSQETSATPENPTPIPPSPAEIEQPQQRKGFFSKMREVLSKASEGTVEGIRNMRNRAREIGIMRFALEMTPIGAHVSNEFEKSIALQVDGEGITDEDGRKARLGELRRERGGIIDVLKFGFGENRSADTWKAAAQTGIVLGSFFNPAFLAILAGTSGYKVSKEIYLEIQSNETADTGALILSALSGASMGIATSLIPAPARLLANGFISAAAAEALFQFDTEINGFLMRKEVQGDARARAFKRSEVFRNSMAIGRVFGSQSMEMINNIGVDLPDAYIQDWFEGSDVQAVLGGAAAGIIDAFNGDVDIDVTEFPVDLDDGNLFAGGAVDSGMDLSNMAVNDFEDLVNLENTDTNFELQPITLPDGTVVVPDWDGDDLDYISANGQVTYDVTGLDSNGKLLFDAPIYTTDLDLVQAGFLEPGQSVLRTGDGEPQFLTIDGEPQYIYGDSSTGYSVDLNDGTSTEVRMIDPRVFIGYGFNASDYQEGTYFADGNGNVYLNSQSIGTIDVNEGTYTPIDASINPVEPAIPSQPDTTVTNPSEGFDLDGDGTIDLESGAPIAYGDEGITYELNQDQDGFFITTEDGRVDLDITMTSEGTFQVEVPNPQTEIVQQFDPNQEITTTLENGTPVLIQAGDIDTININIYNELQQSGGLVLLDIPDGQTVSLDIGSFQTIVVDGNEFLILPSNISASDLQVLSASSCNVVMVPGPTVSQLSVITADMNLSSSASVAVQPGILTNEVIIEEVRLGELRNGFQGRVEAPGDSFIGQLGEFARSGDITPAQVDDYIGLAREYFQHMSEAEQDQYRDFLTTKFGSLQVSRLFDTEGMSLDEQIANDEAFSRWFYTDDAGNVSTSLYRYNGFSEFVGQASRIYHGLDQDAAHSQPPGFEFSLPRYEDVTQTVSGPSTGSFGLTATSNIQVINGGSAIAVNGTSVTSIGAVHVLGGNNLVVPNVSVGVLNGVHFAPLLDPDNNFTAISNGAVFFAGDNQIILDNDRVFISNIFTSESVEIDLDNINENDLGIDTTGGYDPQNGQGGIDDENTVGWFRWPFTGLGQGVLGTPFQGIFNPDGFEENPAWLGSPEAARFTADWGNISLGVLAGALLFAGRNKLREGFNAGMNRLPSRGTEQNPAITPDAALINIVRENGGNPERAQEILDQVEVNEREITAVRNRINNVRNQILEQISEEDDADGYLRDGLNTAFDDVIQNGMNPLEQIDAAIEAEELDGDNLEQIRAIRDEYFGIGGEYRGDNYRVRDQVLGQINEMRAAALGGVEDEYIIEGINEEFDNILNDLPNEIIDFDTNGIAAEVAALANNRVADQGERATFNNLFRQLIHINNIDQRVENLVNGMGLTDDEAAATRERIRDALNQYGNHAVNVQRVQQAIAGNDDIVLDEFILDLEAGRNYGRGLNELARDLAQQMYLEGTDTPVGTRESIIQAMNYRREQAQRAIAAEAGQVEEDPQESDEDFVARIRNLNQTGDQATMSRADLQRLLGYSQIPESDEEFLARFRSNLASGDQAILQADRERYDRLNSGSQAANPPAN